MSQALATSCSTKGTQREGRDEGQRADDEDDAHEHRDEKGRVRGKGACADGNNLLLREGSGERGENGDLDDK